MPRRVLILGSTGSIGVQALDVVDGSDALTVCGLACAGSLDTMREQSAARGGVATAATAGGGSVPSDPGFAALMDATAPDIVLNAIVGVAGLPPTLAALERGIDVALANKESLVAGGDLVRHTRSRTGARLLPVDSEHSALFQLLEGTDRARVRAAVLTASGGPFRGRSTIELADVTVAETLRHPTWAMGAKITVDSATLMNKGLEVIEARQLFELSDDEVEVVVHPQSLIHAMVRLDDGSVLSHCAPPDMRVPIAHALHHPEPPPDRPIVDLTGVTLTFEAPDTATFRCLDLARQAGRAGGTAPAVLNGANEAAVAAFLDGRIGFLDIAALVETALERIPSTAADTLDAVHDADRSARLAVDTAMAVRV